MSAKDARLGVEKQSQRLNSTSAQEEEVRSVLSVNLSRACNEIRAVQADSCIHIGADADVNPNTLLPGTIDEPLPTVEFLRARRQSIVDCVKTIPTEMVHCSWNNTVDNLDKSLSSLGPTTEFENQTGKRLIAFYDDRSKSLATSKYRILARWNLFAVESEFLERFGPDMDTIVRETTDEYYNCRRRCERLKMGAPVMPSDIDGFVDARIRREESGAHVHTFITMLKWIVEDKRGQIFDDIETAATCAQTDESNLSMFIHHDNKSINDELAELMATLRIPIPKDMSNTHRLLSECRPMCKMLLRHAIEQRPRICYEEKSDNDDSQRIKKATWIADQKRAFVQIPPPEYVEYRRRFRDTDIDKMLLYQSMALEQSQDEAGFYDRANEQAKHAAAYAGSMYAAAVQEQGGALYEAPTTQKYMTLYLLKSALTIKLECNIIQTLNVFRAVQRRLVIDAVGGFALEDRLQLHSSQIIGRSSNPCQVSVEHQQPKDFVIPIEEFMAFSGIQTRDDLFEVVEGEPDCFRVRDADGVNIIYDVALNDWKTLRSELLAMGSLYIMKVDASVADKKCFDDEGSKPEHQKCSIECCRSAVLLDLYQCEFAYQSAKSRLVLALLEAYEHIVDPSSGQKLSQRIMDVIASRPQIDLDLCHFRQHYEAETRALQVRFGIVSDIVHHLVAAELSPTTMVRLSLFPFAEPIGLFDICHSVSHIVDCLSLIEDHVRSVEDAWRRQYPSRTYTLRYAHATKTTLLNHVYEMWRQHNITCRLALSPGQCIRKLTLDPLYTDFATVTNRFSAFDVHAKDRPSQSSSTLKFRLSYLRAYDARERILRSHLECALLSEICEQQVATICGSNERKSVLGVKGGCVLVEALGFPVGLIFASCNENNFRDDIVGGLVSMAALQTIYQTGLEVLVKYNNVLGFPSAIAMKYDPSLFPSSTLLSHNSLLSLADITSDVFDRIKRMSSDLSQDPHTKVDAFVSALLSQPESLEVALRTGLRHNCAIMDLVMACDRIRAYVECALPAGSSPFTTTTSVNPSASSSITDSAAASHHIWDLTRGIAVFRDVVLQGSLSTEVNAEEIERESMAVSILFRISTLAISVQRLVDTNEGKSSLLLQNGQSTVLLRSYLVDIRNDLISSMDRSASVGSSRTMSILSDHLQILLGTIRLFTRNRADDILSMFIDQDRDKAIDHLWLFLDTDDKDAQGEVNLHFNRIFHRLSQIPRTKTRLKYVAAVQKTASLHDLFFSLRSLSGNDAINWVDSTKKCRPPSPSTNAELIFADMIKRDIGTEVAEMMQRRVDAFDDPVTIIMKTTVSSPDRIPTPLVLFLLSQEPGELMKLSSMLERYIGIEMEALDVMQIRSRIQRLSCQVHIDRPSTVLGVTRRSPKMGAESFKDFIDEVSAIAVSKDLVIDDAEPKLNIRRRDCWTLPKTDLHLALTRLARSITINQERVFQDYAAAANSIRKSLGSKLQTLEVKMRQAQTELANTKLNTAWQINHGVIDSHFSTVLELEHLKNMEKRVKQRLEAMETTIREQVEREFQREIASLKAQLLMKESRFNQYKADLKKQISTGIHDVRRQAMLGVVDSKRIPFQTKRQALEEIRRFTEESSVAQDFEEMQRTMMRMKTLFEMKEITLQSRLDGQIRNAHEKTVEARELSETLERSQQREKVLVDQLIDEKNAAKQLRDSLQTMRYELEGCQRDRRKLLNLKVKNGRQIAALEADISKYSRLQDVDVDELVTRLSHTERALEQLSMERKRTCSPNNVQVQISRKLKRCESALHAERRAKGEAVSEILSTRKILTDLERQLAESNSRATALAQDLEQERTINAHLLGNGSDLHISANNTDRSGCLREYGWTLTTASKEKLCHLDRPQTSFIRTEAKTPSLVISAKHAAFADRPLTSVKLRAPINSKHVKTF